MKKALVKMTDMIASQLKDAGQKRIMISHCNAPARAETVKNLLADKVSCREICILDTAGISSMYANDGGVIVTL